MLDRYEEPDDQELEDSFLQNEGPVSKSRREATAYQLTGTREPDGYLNLITGHPGRTGGIGAGQTIRSQSDYIHGLCHDLIDS